LIKDNSGQYSVSYTSNIHKNDFTLGTVHFLNMENIQRTSKRKNRLEHISDDTFHDVGQKTKGVLNSVCEGLYHLIKSEEHHQIIATASTQSLKKTDYGDTLKHLEKIFRDAYNSKNNTVFPEKMQKISRRMKHLFIMIDEITGDEGGVEFLQGIHKIVKDYKLTHPENGFNTKIIVADASIVDKNVILQHLEDTTPEPNKIFFRQAEKSIQPLSVESLEFNNLPAIIINTNTYPAKSLTIKYQIIIESCQFINQAKLRNKSNLEKALQNQLLKDIEDLLQTSAVEQIIVYIQNKPKLAELIDKIQSKLGQENFQKNIHYLEIHANISEQEKQDIQKYQETVKISIYYQDDPQISVQESVLSLLNLLLILKTSILTRIQGYGSIGRKKYILIPIGGKSVLAAGETFSSQIASLINQLKKEYNINKSHTSLQQAYTSLEEIMKSGDFVVQKTTETSYLSLQENFNNKFLEVAKTFDKLLDFQPPELGYIHGSLLIVPTSNMEESYQMRLLDIQKYANTVLWENLKSISKSKIYPESLTYAVINAMELVEKLRNAPQKTQKFIQRSQHHDQYYALPLFAFISGKVMKEYFENETQEPEDQRFKDILSSYVRLLYPVGNILPIGHKYQEFPFVVFRSYSLEEIRNKVFTEKYLLNSHELNILNLILSL